jgi:hypothetical protein
MASLARASFAAAVLVALAACEPLDRDVFRCEEAIARILDCCPAVERSPVVCEYRQSALSPYVYTLPDVDCLVGLDCTGIRARDACAWAEAGGVGEVCP